MKLLKKTSFAIAAFAAASAALAGTQKFPRSEAEDTDKLMSKEYWAIWNPEVQKKIDAEIEKNRKADAVVNLGEAAPGGDVKVEQIKHDFIFGAHIFNFNQLGAHEYNERYKRAYGELFNSATVPFYWSDFETQPGRPRFVEEYRDTEEFWNKCKNPKDQRHWRRPATDPIVEFCNKKGIRAHGHPLVWTGYFAWWIYLEEIPKEKLALYRKVNRDKKPGVYPFQKLTQEQAEEMFGSVGETIREITERRFKQIAQRYGNKIQSWDVVNESQKDYIAGVLIPGTRVTRSHIGLLQGDYAFHAFNAAQKYLPTDVALNINDYICAEKYAEQIAELEKRGARIDIAGMQMHLFNPKESANIAAGKKVQPPDPVLGSMNRVAKTGLPIHMSEITITAPGTTKRDWDIQAVIAQNLYRAWFSHPNAMGITWWNVVDDCGAPGEPSYSGIFTRDMQPKSAYYALNNLINNEWKTKLTVKPDDSGKISFRGFKGTYKISWKDKYGRDREMLYHLK